MSYQCRVAQPIPYQGSKRIIAPLILEKIPAHVSRIVEPFAGSAALSIAAAINNQASKFWLNDAHEPLMTLWNKIIFEPEPLAKEYTKLWTEQLGREKEFFNEVRDRFNEFHRPADFLYLLARCVKAAIRYNRKGEFNNTPDNRRKGAHPSEMRQRIMFVSGLLLDRIQLACLDYKEILDSCTDQDLVYMDPPYQGVCRNRDQRYCPKFDHDEFCRELSKLNERNIKYVISYDGRTGNKQYGELLPAHLDLTRFEIPAGKSTQATLLGKSETTYESLYLSHTLAAPSMKLAV